MPAPIPRPALARAAARRRAAAAVLVCAALALAAGCGRRADRLAGPSPPPPENLAAIDAAVLLSGLVSDSLVGFAAVTFDTNLSAPDSTGPVQLRRRWSRYDLGKAYAFADSDAAGRPQRVDVMWCLYVKGEAEVVEFWAADDPTPADSSDRVRRYVSNTDWLRLVRLRRNPAAPFGWAPEAASAAWLLTEGSTVQPFIDSARIEGPGGAIDLAAEVLRVDSLAHRVREGDPLTVVATTGPRPEPILVLLHDASGVRRMIETSPRTWSAPFDPGPAGTRAFTIELLEIDSVRRHDYALSQQGYRFAVRVEPPGPAARVSRAPRGR